jgi:hypothetical protein
MSCDERSPELEVISFASPQAECLMVMAAYSEANQQTAHAL